MARNAEEMLMPLTTIHSIDEGIFRLMNAPRDLPASAPLREPPITFSEASPPHREAFAEYLAAMAEVYDFASKWWEATLDGIVEESGVSRAVNIALSRRLAGPAALPDVVWLVRTYWLKCVEINQSVAEAQRVPPEVFLLKWLIDKGEQEWVKLLSSMPYWPIGLDENAKWC
jgi:hypothetical protein